MNSNSKSSLELASRRFSREAALARTQQRQSDAARAAAAFYDEHRWEPITTRSASLHAAATTEQHVTEQHVVITQTLRQTDDVHSPPGVVSPPHYTLPQQNSSTVEKADLSPPSTPLSTPADVMGLSDVMRRAAIVIRNRDAAQLEATALYSSSSKADCDATLDATAEASQPGATSEASELAASVRAQAARIASIVDKTEVGGTVKPATTDQIKPEASQSVATEKTKPTKKQLGIDVSAPLFSYETDKNPEAGSRSYKRSNRHHPRRGLSERAVILHRTHHALSTEARSTQLFNRFLHIFIHPTVRCLAHVPLICVPRRLDNSGTGRVDSEHILWYIKLSSKMRGRTHNMHSYRSC